MPIHSGNHPLNLRALIIAMAALAQASALPDRSDPDEEKLGRLRLADRFTVEVAKQAGEKSPPILQPPSTHDGFWRTGEGSAKGFLENPAAGLLGSTWEEGMPPAVGGVAAFKGWIFLQPKGRATVCYAMYLYQHRLKGQSLPEAKALKDPTAYKVEIRSFPAEWVFNDWRGSGLRISVTILGEATVDPKFFDAPDKPNTVHLSLQKILGHLARGAAEPAGNKD